MALSLRTAFFQVCKRFSLVLVAGGEADRLSASPPWRAFVVSGRRGEAPPRPQSSRRVRDEIPEIAMQLLGAGRRTQ